MNPSRTYPHGDPRHLRKHLTAPWYTTIVYLSPGRVAATQRSRGQRTNENPMSPAKSVSHEISAATNNSHSDVRLALMQLTPPGKRFLMWTDYTPNGDARGNIGLDCECGCDDRPVKSYDRCLYRTCQQEYQLRITICLALLGYEPRAPEVLSPSLIGGSDA